MKLDRLLESDYPILLDGSMGTELLRRGFPGSGMNNLHAPDMVYEVHRDYIRCGCHALTTNTLTMNRIYMERHPMDVDLRDVNLAGVRLARKAARDLPVLGNISSTGQMLEPYGTYTEEDFIANFREQALYLIEGGVDGFLIETMFDLREALCALRACRELGEMPVIVTIAFHTEKNGGRTIMGDAAVDCSLKLIDAGADAIGANCGDLDPHQMAIIISHVARITDLPIVAQPNAGRPRYEDNRNVFEMGPEEFANGILLCLSAGANILGGCCGTTPDHIQAAADMLDIDVPV